jgi:putative ABC transport system substrate-binding protein
MMTLGRTSALQSAKVWRVGYLTMRAGPAAFDAAFVRRMAELGYIVGKSLVIEYRWAANDALRLQPMADELVALNMDVLVVATTYAVRAAMRATKTIPIVIAAVGDPVGSGLVASLRRPGGNVTGLTLQSTDVAQKRLQLIREVVPGTTRVALLFQADSEPGSPVAALMSETQAAARALGVTLISRPASSIYDFPDAFQHFEKEQAQALIVPAAPLTIEYRAAIATLAARQRLPAIGEIPDFAESGGLVSYGPDLQDMYRRAAVYVDRILRGAKPAEMAIEQPAKLEFVINLKAAKAMGLVIPQALVVRANQVIQ